MARKFSMNKMQKMRKIFMCAFLNVNRPFQAT